MKSLLLIGLLFSGFVCMSIITTTAEADFTRCKINNLWKTKRPIR